MNWYKIGLGLIVLIAVVVVYYRWLRHVRGDSGSGLDLSMPKRKRGAGPNDLETFIAARRAAQQLSGNVASAPATPASDTESSAPMQPERVNDELAASGNTASTNATMEPASDSLMLIKPKTTLGGNLGPTALLSPEHKLLYLICRTAMPAHHIFAKIGVSDVLPALSDQPDMQGMTFDIVACRADMTVLAVANLSDHVDASAQAKLTQASSAAKVRYVVVNPKEMPRPQELREKLSGA